MIAALAAAQHGVVARWQLLQLGVTEGEIRARLSSGHLHPIHRGVYAVGHTELSLLGRWMAAVLACGDGSLLSHRPAGALWGIAPYSGQWIDVTAPTPGRRSRSPLAIHAGRIHRDDRDQHEGIPVTSASRTLLDLAEIVNVRRLERALERAEKRELVDLAEIQATIERGRGRRGLKNLKRALAMHLPGDRSRSDFERDFIDFCRDHELRQPQVNVLVAGATREYEVDAFWPEARLIVELDSWEHHRTRASFEGDRARDADLRLAGYTVIRITWRRIEHEPLETARLIARLLASSPEVPEFLAHIQQ